MTAPLDCSASEAMTSPHLFGPFFEGDSWNTWFATVKGTFGERLDGSETELFDTVASRTPPTKRVGELVIAAGRGAGKDSIASFLAAYLAVSFDLTRVSCVPASSVLCLAVDKSQAAIAFRYIRGYFEAIPALAAMVCNIGASTIELSNHVVIEVSVASFRAVRGRTILAAILDELAFLRDGILCKP